jgi:uncharacterized protein (TIGR02145 family)
MMKKVIIHGICYFLLILGFVLLIGSCGNDNDPLVPIVSTDSINHITLNSARIVTVVYMDGGADVTERGVCWSESIEPTVDDYIITSGTGIGVFAVRLSGLDESTTYYVRSYATNSAGTSYSNVKSFTTQVMDKDTNIYNAIHIGSQVWMVENLKTSKYNDGTDIPLVTVDTVWVNQTEGGFCWYDNNKVFYKDVFGALYNWSAVNSGKLAPVGWHIPSQAEWMELSSFLYGELVAGGKLKENGHHLWMDPNLGATNETGFTAVPSGYRSNIDGTFLGIGEKQTWWSSSVDLWSWSVYYDSQSLTTNPAAENFAFSVRCIKD